MDMFTGLIVVMILWMCTYVQTQVVNIQYVQLFACQSQIKKKISKEKQLLPKSFQKELTEPHLILPFITIYIVWK